ncbi:carbamoyl-phosphate synthase (glutamine-hydrolyzing) large subunit [Candidatus Daviesbacteria bacterium]|nr:carbamoyl-phosphate synthase (glutamine-hydrolyzing) large subunit [Candidatus Daviesbacteria bacterium]
MTMIKPKKVLLLGSGALKIGEAGEFDYSGSQALKALKEEGINVVLVNPNIATIQTSQELAGKIYFLPVTPYFVQKIIEKEKPDCALLSFGGQTALNCGLNLSGSGVFKKNKITVLGTPVKSIEITEDRQLFAKYLGGIGIKAPRGGFARDVKGALMIANKIGYPVMVRSGFSLGGLGSSVVNNKEDLNLVVSMALKNAPQVAIEEYLRHWKEIEYEIVRDKGGNKIAVCNMENMDPVGIHTGESIVVAPSQTLNNYQYHLLRQISLKVIEHLGIVGECNIQFALDPKSDDYRVIEVNARLSRSSALASKATGYPLAYIACKLSLGYSLRELKNIVTGTSAFFEPALDYIVVKIPRWDLQKFEGANLRIGSEMKSVGEVMAIGRSFPESLQKAVRMLETGQDGLLGMPGEDSLSPGSLRLFAIAQQFLRNSSVESISKETGIDQWFLNQVKEIVDYQKNFGPAYKFNNENFLQAKKLGFSDNLIAASCRMSLNKVRKFRERWNIYPKTKHIDTLAAEYPAKTNYLYMTYHGEESENDSRLRIQDSGFRQTHNCKKVIVLGAGPYRIGSSVEFDWCLVTAVATFRQQGLETIVINCNPETVSTDFDIADKLYFEELTLERIVDIYKVEKNAKLVLAFGGQIPNNLAALFAAEKMAILGTPTKSIDFAEDRHKFSALLDRLSISQPQWEQIKNTGSVKRFAGKVGYPVLIRPSYVLSGSAMNIANSSREVAIYLNKAAKVSSKHPVVISKFIDNAKEIEIDGVAKSGKLLIYAISEHIENAGVHSGDATLVLPPQRLYLETMRQIKLETKKILKVLNIHGPFNIQFLAKDNKVMVIELNLRASRSFPFVSKVTGINFIEIAAKVIVGENITGDFQTVDLDYVGVKAPQFSFNRIKEADPKLKVEMSSTGEVACFGRDLHEAYLKALFSTGWKMPEKSIFLSIGGDKNKLDFLESARKLTTLNLEIFATEGTSKFLKLSGIKNTTVFKLSEGKHPTVLDLIKKAQVDLAINISLIGEDRAKRDGFIIRRNCVDFAIPLMTNLQAAIEFSYAVTEKKLEDLQIKSWDEYLSPKN